MKRTRPQFTKYYMIIPIKFEPKVCCNQERIVAIDPGSRTFATTYDPADFRVTEYCFGNDFKKNVGKHFLWSDIYRKRRDKLLRQNAADTKEDLPTQRKMSKYDFLTHQLLKENQKARNKITDLHRKVAKDLVSNYGIIVIGKLSTRGSGGNNKEKPTQQTKKLPRKANRQLLSLSHYRFREFLAHKCREYGRRLIVEDESYTSMTCSECNTRNRQLGCSKNFVCPDKLCGYATDRDVNGAKNILRKFLGLM